MSTQLPTPSISKAPQSISLFDCHSQEAFEIGARIHVRRGSVGLLSDSPFGSVGLLSDSPFEDRMERRKTMLG